MRSAHPWGPHACRTCRWRARVAPGLLAALMAAPGPALPYSLDSLLRMPLERLLQLQVVPRRAAQIGAPEAAVAQDRRAGGGGPHEV